MSTKERSSIKSKRFSPEKAAKLFVGYDRLAKLFAGLADKRRLSHGYIFFGEQGVVKFTFASRLANYLEFDSFDESKTPRSESMVIAPPDGKENIGIDAVRDIKYFLFQQPVASSYRAVIIDEAEALTDQAQNALLKISEEPPPHGLVILVVANPESLLATLQSRFQKIYFPRLSISEVEKYLRSAYGITEQASKEAAERSFGRMGRAIELAANGEEIKTARKDALELLKSKDSRILGTVLEDARRLNLLVREMIAELAGDPEKNLFSLKELLKRSVLNYKLNTNKRLQLEAVLWNI